MYYFSYLTLIIVFTLGLPGPPGPPTCSYSNSQPLALHCPLPPFFFHVAAPVGRSAPLRSLVQKSTPRRPYLSDGLFISHGRSFYEAADFYVPIAARNDHPGPAEAHRHFHFSCAALIPLRKKLRPNKNHPRRAKVPN